MSFFFFCSCYYFILYRCVLVVLGRKTSAIWCRWLIIRSSLLIEFILLLVQSYTSRQSYIRLASSQILHVLQVTEQTFHLHNLTLRFISFRIQKIFGFCSYRSQNPTNEMLA